MRPRGQLLLDDADEAARADRQELVVGLAGLGAPVLTPPREAVASLGR